MIYIYDICIYHIYIIYISYIYIYVFYIYMEVSINGGTPNSWMVYFMENPLNMDDLRVPPFQETSIDNQENVG